MRRGGANLVLAVMSAVSVALGLACSFDTRTGAYSCELPSDCEDGRVCLEGWCVVEGAQDDAATTDAGNNPADARDSAPVIDADCGASIDFEPSNFGSCAVPPPGEAIDLGVGSDWVIDTDTGEIREVDGASTALSSVTFAQPIGPEILIVSVASLNIAAGATLAVEGDRPLALVSAGDVVIDGLLWASASGATAGPGGGVASVCADGDGEDGVTQQGGGADGGSGGGGGAYGSAGGEGGIVEESGGASTPGGSVSGNAGIEPLRGGCNGGTGGLVTGGTGGGGGGAIQLVAGTSIEVSGSGVVSAPGGGGSGVSEDGSGGGGGGSGGALLLEAHTITIAGFVTAHGGGGGEGARNDTPTGDGQDGHRNNLVPANGGNFATGGGDGGDGAVEGSDAEAGSVGNTRDNRPAGGGGGGGGVGRIRLRGIDSAPTVSGTVSPAPG